MMLLFIPVLLFTVVNGAMVTPCQGPGDIVFALDGSESIHREDFQKMINFTLKIIESFEFGPNKVRVGAMVFSTIIPEYFSPSDNSGAVKSRISNFNHPRNITRTDLAIAYMRQRLLKTSRTRVGVIITDGESSYPNDTKKEAVQARGEGITLVAIGIGIRESDEAELEAIAGDKSLVKLIDNFRQLENKTILTEIMNLSCRVMPKMATTPAPLIYDDPEKIIIDPLCEGCIIDNGFGYNYFKYDCSKFVVCYPSEDSHGNKIMTSAVKQCGFSTFWSQDDLTCVKSEYTECQYSICKGKTNATTLPYVGCRSYWKCQDGLPEPMCCPAGQHYDNTQKKCVVGVSAKCSGVNCDGAVRASLRKKPACDYEENSKDPATYYQILRVPGFADRKFLRNCAPGTIYKDLDCMCVLDLKGIAKKTTCSAIITQGSNGQFYWQKDMALPYGNSNLDLTSEPDAITYNSKSHVNIWRLANHEFMDSLGIEMSVKLTPFTGKKGSKTEQILLNCLHSDAVLEEDQCSPSMSLQVKKEPNKYTFIAELHTLTDRGTEYNETISSTVSSTSGYKGYIPITFAYDGDNFALKADGNEKSVPLTGWIQRRQTGLVFGRPTIRNTSVGFLDGSIKEINVYDCIPLSIKDALKIM
ncbi:protein PIF-like [Mytilus californianus]|uniref:protein PIF-like n=1 Tax=Mytilus californianus TaxID=6549 RepID=UPI0022470FC8|nr:protein PIF-like [Mytilus californianus]